MELKKVNLKDIAPYKNNPRKNDEAVDAVMESIRQCEYVAPIIVDENMEILAGHTRYKALLKLGKTEENVIIKEGLTEEQKRKYQYYDNRTNELAQWDDNFLLLEIGDLDMGDLSYLWEPQEENKYDFSEFESENERLKGTETVPNSIGGQFSFPSVGEFRYWLGDSAEKFTALMAYPKAKELFSRRKEELRKIHERERGVKSGQTKERD